MWNENGPLELLKNMPNVLTEENLAEIQKVIDYDKFVNSQQLAADLCGSYAPFCKNCDKSVTYPCAVAYIRMKIAEGMEVKMENIPSVAPQPEEAPVQSAPKTKIRIAIARKKA